MDFDKSFGMCVISSKKLEARWFLNGTMNGEVTKKFFHRMPFKRRNLSYWRGTRNTKQKKKRRHKSQDNNNILKRNGFKKLDLLNTVWKHRVRRYNDAFLKSPRRATRNFSKTICNPSSFIMDRRVGDDEGWRRLSRFSSTPGKRERQLTKNSSRLSKKRKLSVYPSYVNGDAGKDNSTATTSGTLSFEKSSINERQLTQITCFPSPVQCVEDSCGLKWSKEGSLSSSVELKTRVLFHFLYLKEQSVCIQTDTMFDLPPGHRFCPFCYLDCGTDSGLIMHCVTCHGEQLAFQAARSEDGSLHIAITKKNPSSSLPTTTTVVRDFCYVRPNDKRKKRYASIPFVERTPNKIAEMDAITRRKKTRFLSELGADESVLQNFLPSSDVPIRQYFHSRSNEPMLYGDWDIDSDEEDDERWLTKMSEELLEDFEDVTTPEKCFTKLWNRFMRCHVVVPDHEIPSRCLKFIETYYSELNCMNLRQELLLHLCGLWDTGLISSSHLSQFMRKFEELANFNITQAEIADLNV